MIDREEINHLLTKLGEEAIKIYGNNPEDYPSGRNGPHNDNVTNCRIVSHYVIIFFHLYQLTGERKYKELCLAGIKHIVKSVYKDLFFYNRNTNGKDPNNGLIGQVWCLEPIIIGSDLVSQEQLNIVKAVIRNHSFSFDTALFEYPILIGDKVSYQKSFTLNQQVWFCAIVDRFNEVFGTKLFSDEIDKFTNKVLDYITVNRAGELNNLIQLSSFGGYNMIVKKDYRKIFNTVVRVLNSEQKYLKAAYSLFSLLGLVNNRNLRHQVESKYDLKYLMQKHLDNKLLLSDENQYSWGYNVSGIELARLDKAVNGTLSPDVNAILMRQIGPARHFRIPDPVTYNARFYELVYLVINYKGLY